MPPPEVTILPANPADTDLRGWSGESPVRQHMTKITEFEATAEVRSALAGGSREALTALGAKATAAPKSIVEAIDQFVFDWQDGKRPKAGTFDEPDDVPVALGS